MQSESVHLHCIQATNTSQDTIHHSTHGGRGGERRGIIEQAFHFDACDTHGEHGLWKMEFSHTCVMQEGGSFVDGWLVNPVEAVVWGKGDHFADASAAAGAADVDADATANATNATNAAAAAAAACATPRTEERPSRSLFVFLGGDPLLACGELKVKCADC